MVVSEMVASDELVRGSTEALLRSEGEGVAPHVVQLAGCDPRWMGEAARIAEGSGAAVVDINMGCPAKRVTGGYAGSALMRDPVHALSLIEATVSAVSIPVTVKMRLGWDRDSLNAPELARRAEAAGVRMVTVHGRTRQQFYKGQADWDAIAAVKSVVSIPVTANGDCRTGADAHRMRERSGADAVMIGRGALGRPWLVGAVGRALDGLPEDVPDTVDRFEAACEHYETLLGLYGREVGIRHARKHLAAYADVHSELGHSVPPSARLRIVTSEDPGEVLALLRTIFEAPRVEAVA